MHVNDYLLRKRFPYLFFFPLESVLSDFPELVSLTVLSVLSFLKRAKNPFFFGGAGIAPPRTLLSSVM